MTLQEAIDVINTRSRNLNLQWFAYKWNDGYAICTGEFVIKHNIKYEYGTGDPKVKWSLSRDFNGKSSHIVHERYSK